MLKQALVSSTYLEYVAISWMSCLGCNSYMTKVSSTWTLNPKTFLSVRMGSASWRISAYALFLVKALKSTRGVTILCIAFKGHHRILLQRCYSQRKEAVATRMMPPGAFMEKPPTCGR
eukprot:PhF_6_TR2184/c0_g1_i1/m.3597